MKTIHALAAQSRPDWPDLTWDSSHLAALLGQASREQVRLLGRMQDLGFDLRREAQLNTLTEDVVRSSQILDRTAARHGCCRASACRPRCRGRRRDDARRGRRFTLKRRPPHASRKIWTIAGLAHVWFVTIHPFDDGNGRIARAIEGSQDTAYRDILDLDERGASIPLAAVRKATTQKLLILWAAFFCSVEGRDAPILQYGAVRKAGRPSRALKANWI